MKRWVIKLGMTALAVTTGGIALSMTGPRLASATPSPVVIALITSLTGPAVPQFPNAQRGSWPE